MTGFSVLDAPLPDEDLQEWGLRQRASLPKTPTGALQIVQDALDRAWVLAQETSRLLKIQMESWDENACQREGDPNPTDVWSAAGWLTGLPVLAYGPEWERVLGGGIWTDGLHVWVAETAARAVWRQEQQDHEEGLPEYGCLMQVLLQKAVEAAGGTENAGNEHVVAPWKSPVRPWREVRALLREAPGGLLVLQALREGHPDDPERATQEHRNRLLEREELQEGKPVGRYSALAQAWNARARLEATETIARGIALAQRTGEDDGPVWPMIRTWLGKSQQNQGLGGDAEPWWPQSVDGNNVVGVGRAIRVLAEKNGSARPVALWAVGEFRAWLAGRRWKADAGVREFLDACWEHARAVPGGCTEDRAPFLSRLKAWAAAGDPSDASVWGRDDGQRELWESVQIWLLLTGEPIAEWRFQNLTFVATRLKETAWARWFWEVCPPRDRAMVAASCWENVSDRDTALRLRAIELPFPDTWQSLTCGLGNWFDGTPETRVLFEEGTRFLRRNPPAETVDNVTDNPLLCLVVAGAPWRTVVPLVRAGVPINGNVNPNMPGAGGSTALHAAAGIEGGERLVRVLLRVGADPERTNSEGHTPWVVALLKKNEKASRAFACAGTNPGGSLMSLVMQKQKMEDPEFEDALGRLQGLCALSWKEHGWAAWRAAVACGNEPATQCLERWRARVESEGLNEVLERAIESEEPRKRCRL